MSLGLYFLSYFCHRNFFPGPKNLLIRSGVLSHRDSVIFFFLSAPEELLFGGKIGHTTNNYI